MGTSQFTRPIALGRILRKPGARRCSASGTGRECVAAGGQRDPALIGELIAIVFERFPDTSSAEHRAVMTAVLDLYRQLRERGGARWLQ